MSPADPHQRCSLREERPAPFHPQRSWGSLLQQRNWSPIGQLPRANDGHEIMQECQAGEKDLRQGPKFLLRTFSAETPRNVLMREGREQLFPDFAVPYSHLGASNHPDAPVSTRQNAWGWTVGPRDVITIPRNAKFGNHSISLFS